VPELLELFAEEAVHEPLTDDALALPGEDDELARELFARRLLLRLRAIGAHEDRLKALRAAVVAPYNEKLDELEAETDRVRAALLDFAQRFGKLSIPDAGSFHTRKTAAHVSIADQEAMLNAYGDRFTRDPKPGELFDRAAFFAWANANLKDSGEIPQGCDVTPDTYGLTVKLAKVENAG
jgi:hypothetical protein